jgi:hypothetical protein
VSKQERFYRCRVTADLSAGTLQVGRKRFDVLVDEKSIDGYTIRIKADDLAKIKFNRKVWILEHFQERSEVHPEWFLNPTSDLIQLGLRRLADVTPQPKAPSVFRSIFSLRGLLHRLTNSPEMMLGGAAMILLMLLTLPGFGDHLGTAPRIRQGSIFFVQFFDETVRSIFR